MLELDDRDVAVRVACVRASRRDPRLSARRSLVQAGVPEEDAAHVAAQVHMLMKGSIVAAGEGDTHAAARAREVVQRCSSRTSACDRLDPELLRRHRAPSRRASIFCIATSRAKSGEPCFGFTSRLNGEKPQSSVAPRRSTGMCFAAVRSSSRTLSGVSTSGVSGLTTPDEADLADAVASARLYSPQSS